MDLALIRHSDKQKSRDAGIDRHLVKPIGLDDLIDVLNDADRTPAQK